jgi:hypothetical protein
MALLIEDMSIVVNLEGVRRAVAGGTSTLAAWLPPGKVTMDGELAVVSFRTPAQADRLSRRLAERGLPPSSIALVSAAHGPMDERPWLDFGHVAHPEGPIPVVMRRGSLLRLVVLPTGRKPRPVACSVEPEGPFAEPFQFTVTPES